MKSFFAVPLMTLTLMSIGTSASAAVLKAGVGATDIQISPQVLPVEGYTSVHDPISTRVLLLDNGGLRIGMLVVDTPSIQDAFIDSWRAILVRVDGVKPEDVLVIASHDTSAPHVSLGAGGGPGGAPGGARPAGAGGPGGNGGGPGGNGGPGAGPTAKAYAEAVNTSVEASATKALATLQPVQLGFGLGTSRINTNRDVLTAKGWGVGYNDAGFIDPSLGIVRVNTLDGKPLAWLMNYSVRPAIMERSIDDKTGKAISGDLVDASEHYLESHSTPGGTAIFLMGAGVDQTPYLMANRFVLDKDGNSSNMDIHEAGFNLVDLLGERLGSEAVRVSNAIKASDFAGQLRIVRQIVDVKSQVPAIANGAPPMAAGEAVKIPFVLIQMGDIAFVGVAPELNANIGVKIRAESPFAHTIVVTMVDGSAKYLPDTTNYDRRTPEALGSRYARGSAENAATQIIAALKQLHADSKYSPVTARH